MATPLLTADEERELAVRIAAGDADARRVLIERNMRLVWKIASRFARPGPQLDDLVGEGYIGLIRAAEAFDPDRGRFSTIATEVVRRHILDFLFPPRRKRVATVSDADGILAVDPHSSEMPVDDADETTELRRRMAHRLDAREQDFLAIRYGLDGSDGATLAQVGGRLGFSKQRASQIELRALTKLRD
jgi:RNA polymerase sigma factor (sigma-70 family)